LTAAERVRQSFEKQKLMKTLGAKLTAVRPGRVEIELPFSVKHVQQHGYLHAGVLTSVADSACGYAALSVAPSGAEVLTVEYKVSFLSPARGNIRAVGQVLRRGRTITSCAADVFAEDKKGHTLVCTMLATIITHRKRD
jgi:uncharacterized protein (TIGR00369 family)